MAAPADGWAPGVEEILLARATQLAREALPGDPSPLAAGDIAAVGPGFEQRFEGTLRRETEVLAVRGRHWLGFAGDPREAIVCTAICTEPQAGAPGSCAGLVAAATQGGTWTEAPPPSLVARTLLLAADHPQAALGVLVAVSLAAAALVIARRPRPRP